MKIIQITDTHLGAPDERVGGLFPIDRLSACMADIEVNHADAAFCVISGDITDAGEVAAYQALSAILSTSTVPVILMMGNHDHRENMCDLFPHIPRDIDGFVQWRWETDQGVFLFLDTVDHGRHEGLYCERRRAWLSDNLDESRDRQVYLFMHHPPFDVGLPGLDAIGIREREALAELLSHHKNIRHLFFGHVHRPIAGSWQGIPFTSLKGTNHAVALDFTALEYIPRCHEPPTYAIILIEDDKVLVHFHDFLDQTKIVLDEDGRWVFALTGKDVQGDAA